MPPPEPTGPSPWQQVGLVLTLGITFAAAVAIGLIAGVWLDSKLGTKLLFTQIGRAHV